MDTNSPEALAAFRSLLVTLEAELVASVESMRDGSAPVDLGQPIGRLSRMDAIQQQKMVEANRQRARQRLVSVRAALKRVEAEAYGVCAKCGEDIAEKRLRARPESSLCMACQTELEGHTRRRR